PTLFRSQKKWIYWSVEPVQLPQNVELCIGWTGTPASTSQLVSQILALQKSHPKAFELFLNRSNHAVTTFLKGVKAEDATELFHGVKMNRQALADVGRAACTAIETPLLCTLSDLAEQYGGAGKSSGAGGGDCGIAFLPSEVKTEKMRHDWIQKGIKPLALAVSPVGSIVSE